MMIKEFSYIPPEELQAVDPEISDRMHSIVAEDTDGNQWPIAEAWSRPEAEIICEALNQMRGKAWLAMRNSDPKYWKDWNKIHENLKKHNELVAKK